MSGKSLEECNVACSEDKNCVWFEFGSSSGVCTMKKEGCELYKASETGTNSYRPTGYVPLGYRMCPEGPL